MRDNKELLEKIKKIYQEVEAEVEPSLERILSFRISSMEVMDAAIKSVQDAINPMNGAELIFLIPALRVVADSTEYFLNEQERLILSDIYDIMKIRIEGGVKKENVWGTSGSIKKKM